MENDLQLTAELTNLEISIASYSDQIQALHVKVDLFKESGINNPSQLELLRNEAREYKIKLLPLLN
jgi:hypothetical protein